MTLNSRKFGFWAIWAIGVGTVVGDGVFLLIGEGISAAGPSSIIVYVIAGLIQMALMISLGELAVGFPSGGAQSVWVEHFMGRHWGLVSGLAGSIGFLVLNGGLALALGTFTCYYFPSLNQDVWTIIFALIYITIMIGLNIIGVGVAAKTQLVLVMVLVAIMVVFGIVGIFSIDGSNFEPFSPNGMKGTLAALPSGIYVYMGAVALCTAGDECRNKVDLGRALVWSSITFLVIYTLGMIVVVGTVPYEKIGLDVSPYALAGEVVFSKAGGIVLNSAAWIATATSILMGTIYVPSRMFSTMAEQGNMPQWLGRLNKKTGTPVNALIIIWIFSVLTIIASVVVEKVYVFVTNQATMLWIISWVLALIAGCLYRSRTLKGKDIKKELGWKQPLYPLCPIVGFVGCAYTMYV